MEIIPYICSGNASQNQNLISLQSHRMAIIYKREKASVGRGVDKSEILYIAHGNT